MPPKKAPEVLGTMTCPHCGTDSATIHAQKGNGYLYYRCYGGAQGDCGTVQLFGDGGQEWIRARLERPPETAEAPESSGPDLSSTPVDDDQLTPAPAPDDPDPAPGRAAAREPADDSINIGAFLNRFLSE